jgi:large subunit ribosomal protein L29
MKSKELLAKLRSDNQLELEAELKKNQEELHKLKMQLVAKQLSNPHRIRQVKKDIARIMSVLSEKAGAAGGKA